MRLQNTREEVIDKLNKGKEYIPNLLLEAYGEGLEQVVDEVFLDALEIGITNTIIALYDANVKDEDILRIVNKHWGINREEIADRLIAEKSDAVIRSLKEYMKLHGYTKGEIEEFIKCNQLTIKVRREKELWKFKNAPQKLVDMFENKKRG